ncbi:hypothetical protein K0M31_016217 [Melipona bicolor]|uniref:Uncharacterized protein n=1 Tax=Melipona bicolor TaxID=60889 RepID=A0AA40G7X2_9HYME|nr:hypothetical protein K0M31_016217 [Melipona bicolor]
MDQIRDDPKCLRSHRRRQLGRMSKSERLRNYARDCDFDTRHTTTHALSNRTCRHSSRNWHNTSCSTIPSSCNNSISSTVLKCTGVPDGCAVSTVQSMEQHLQSCSEQYGLNFTRDISRCKPLARNL